MQPADSIQGHWRWRSLVFASVFMAHQVYRLLLIAVFSFPVAASFVVSGLLLDPSIPEASKHQLFQLIIDRFDQVFQYSITLALLLAFAVNLLGMFKHFLGRLSSRRSVVTEDLLGSAKRKASTVKAFQAEGFIRKVSTVKAFQTEGFMES